MSVPSPRLFTRSFALIASTSALLLSGCGIGSFAPASDTAVASTISGKLYGGNTPISGSTVTLYATQSNGYGGAAVQLGNTATSQADGSFTFVNSTPYSCPSGQQAYAVATGGNSGAGSNANIMLMAAIGDCSKLAAGTRDNVSIFMSELSTVAAAYALNNFISISGSTVNISAPAAANNSTGSCTLTGTSTTSCATASLAHAFLNAANLVSAIGTTTAPATGAAYTVAPSNTASSVPQALINTLGNILVYCVNSTGGTAAGTHCGDFFTNATPPSGTAPTNTLQAMMNIARYPARNVNTLYGYAGGAAAAFVPAVSSGLRDFSLAVVYNGLGSGTAITYPYYVALDINDTVYSANQTGSSSAAATGAFVTTLGSNGAPGLSNTNISANFKCVAASACLMATDTRGFLWIPNTNTSSNPNIYKLSTSTLALSNTFSLTSNDAPNAVAVDPLNNVYLASAVPASTTVTANLFVLKPTDSTFGPLTTTVASTTSNVDEAVNPEAIAIDSNLDISNINFASGASASTYIANTNSDITTNPTFTTPVSTTESASVGSPYSILFDGSNNQWINNQTTLFLVPRGSVTPTLTVPLAAANGVGTTVTASSARYGGLDGVGNIFTPQNVTNSSYIFEYVPNVVPTTAGTVYPLYPCFVPAGATTCQTSTTAGSTPAVYGPRNLQIDSTGALWIASSTNNSIVQVIGVGAPTWPQLSYAHPGVKPQ